MLEKLKEYNHKIHVCGKRNSYSKTDTDATFMRMKEDAMKNGQLKPAYNLQHGIDAEYVVWLEALANPTDTPTLVPFLEDMGQHLSFKYMNIVADAGYESEENYSYIEEHGQFAYIKPSNYEISKTRKYQADISNRENMVYDEEKDCYRCSQGNLLKAAGSKQPTGTSEAWKVNNIYDLAGNVDEWTTETAVPTNHSVRRGGNYSGTNTSSRAYHFTSLGSNRTEGFRTILYL